jgi:hypothetical protein
MLGASVPEGTLASARDIEGALSGKNKREVSTGRPHWREH